MLIAVLTRLMGRSYSVRHALGRFIFLFRLIKSKIVQVPVTKLSHLQQHNATRMHKTNFQRYSDTKKRQQLLTNTNTDAPDPFTAELCEMMIKVDIPFAKINNPAFKGFLEKYCGRKMPSQPTLREYLPKCYEKVFLF